MSLSFKILFTGSYINVWKLSLCFTEDSVQRMKMLLSYLHHLISKKKKYMQNKLQTHSNIKVCGVVKIVNIVCWNKTKLGLSLKCLEYGVGISSLEFVVTLCPTPLTVYFSRLNNDEGWNFFGIAVFFCKE